MAAVVAAGAASPAAPRSARGGDDRDDHEGASEKTRALGAITDAPVISEHLIGRAIIALYMSDRETTKGMTLNGINAWLPSPDIPTAPGESGRHGARERSRVTPHVIAGRAGRAPGPREAGLTSRLIRSRSQHFQVGVRGPAGVSFELTKVPVEFFLEVAPGAWFVDWVDFDLDAAIGARYYF